MAGEDNLIPVRSVDEAREKGKKGGVASGAARREKAMLREAAEIVLSRKILPGDIETAMENMGISKSKRTNAMAMVIGMVMEAEGGNPAAFEKIMKLMGEGIERQETTTKLQIEAFDDINLSDEELREIAGGG